MLPTQACPNSRHIESEQGDENGFDVPVLSSDESSLSGTFLDDACDAFFDHKALEAGTLAKRPPEQLGKTLMLRGWKHTLVLRRAALLRRVSDRSRAMFRESPFPEAGRVALHPIPRTVTGRIRGSTFRLAK